MFPQEKKRSQVDTRASSDDGKGPTFDPPPFVNNDFLTVRYQSIAKKVHSVRIVLFGIVLIASVAVIGFSGSSLRKYGDVGSQADWVVPLWPRNIDLRPSHAILACGIITAVFSLTYLIASFIPLVRR